MVRRRVEDELDGLRQRPDVLGVNPELVDQADREAGEHHPRRNSQERQRHPHDQLTAVVPLLAQGGGEVEVMAGVVRLMSGPDQPHSVGETVIGVEQHIDADQGDHPRVPPPRRQVPGRNIGVERRITQQPQELQAPIVATDTSPIEIDARASGLRYAPRAGLAGSESAASSLRAALHSMVSSSRKNGMANTRDRASAPAGQTACLRVDPPDHLRCTSSVGARS